VFLKGFIISILKANPLQLKAANRIKGPLELNMKGS